MFTFLAGILAWIAANLGGFTGLSPKVQGLLAAAGVVLGFMGIRAAPGTPSPLLTLLDKSGTGWKTAAGLALGAIGYLTSPDVLAVLPAGIAQTLIVVGSVLAGFGLYHATAKARA